MARDFNGSSDYLSAASSPIADYPFSMACWFNCDVATAQRTLIEIRNGTGNLSHQLETRGDQGGDPVGARSSTGAGGIFAESTAGYTAGTWHHAAGVWTSATSRAAFIDGGSKGTNATSRAPTGFDNMQIGRKNSGGGGSDFFDGRIFAAAIWDAALTDDEVASLGKGFSPLLIRPGSLVFYAPILGRYSPEIEIFAARDLTVTGTAVAAHNRLFNPGPK